ncbi:MAG: transglycosylase SLT domain-containing protein [Pseudomonadota bacterium]
MTSLLSYAHDARGNGTLSVTGTSRRPAGRGVRGLPLLSLLAFLLAAPVQAFFDPAAAAPRNIDAGREIYLELLKAARAGRWGEFEELRGRLGDYPLAGYARYERLKARLRTTPGSTARDFIAEHRQDPLGLRYLDHYLSSAGRDRRWGDFLAVATREPRSERLRCYYARAKRGRGAQDEAWALASRLFLSGTSVHKACDPLFRLWREADGLNDDLIWNRARLAFGARQGGLLRYVASLGGPQVALDALRRVYREPHRVTPLIGELAQPYRGQVLTLGLERLARQSPRQALRQYQAQPYEELNATQRARIEAAIARRALIEREIPVRPWIDEQLPRWDDDNLTVLRLRWALAESDWEAIEQFTALLHTPVEGAWRYWSARSLQERGSDEAAFERFRKLALERSYYGFLSADHLDLPYSFNDARAPEPDVKLLAALPEVTKDAIWRVHELKAIDRERLAHAEWTYLIQRSDREAQLLLASFAASEGWYRLAIDAANAGEARDALALRFPLAYRDAFEKRAALRQLPVSELMAIARRESAFFADARSPVGARGLMQLMPSTGIEVARRSGLRLDANQLYSVNHNLDLGSAYYRELLDLFDGNRAFALAAYNAGPHRVQRWIASGLPVDAWIETIPFRETREYVKAVLAYSVVFDYRLGRDAQLMTAAEAHGGW